MRDLQIPAVSTEYLYVPDVVAFDPSSPDAAVDVTTLPVDFAFVAPGVDPTDVDWVPGSWAPLATSPTARLLLGPTGIALSIGVVTVWMRVRGAVEAPARPVAKINVI